MDLYTIIIGIVALYVGYYSIKTKWRRKKEKEKESRCLNEINKLNDKNNELKPSKSTKK